MELKEHYIPTFPLPLTRLEGDSSPAGLDADYAVCRAIMQKASKNYSFANRMLPQDKAHHVTALYAVMRIGDDLVDVDHGGFASPQAAIEHWQAAYWRVFEAGDSPHPALRAYVATAHTFNIAPELLSTYFRAMIEDLTITRFPTFDDLLHYMDGSAIPVGRIMSHILGTTTPCVEDAYPQADALSVAMQLSNFWRDIGEDWERGRVYIPQEDLERFQYSEQDLAARRIDNRLTDLLEYEFARTETYYQAARQGINKLATGRLGVRSALELYRAIMFAIRRNDYDVFTRRAGAGKARKLGLLGKAWLLTR